MWFKSQFQAKQTVSTSSSGVFWGGFGRLAFCAVVCLGFMLSFLNTLDAGDARFKVVGKGKKQHLDVIGFPAEQAKRYDLFKVKCSKCHTLVRPISAVRTGVTPVTGDPFDNRYVSKYVGKMMRKLNSGITRADAQEIAIFLVYLLELAEKQRPS